MSIHPSALVDASAVLAPNVTVGPFAVVEPDVEIGAGCDVRAHAVVKRFTTIGAGCVIHEHAVLGGEPQDLKFDPATVSYLRIGERKKRFVKGAPAVVAEETLLIEGFSGDPKGITAWMDALLKSGAFASINLLSMERKGASYRYQIECGLPVR